MFKKLQMPVRVIEPIKPMLNIGACLDIPTGTIVKGRYGESILNGGLGMLTGVTGTGNMYKSAIMNYMIAQCLGRHKHSTATTYDTEMNIHEDRLRSLYNSLEDTDGEDFVGMGRWTVTDRTIYSGDEYYDILKDYMEDKAKNVGDILVDTPFVSRNGDSYVKIPYPTFGSIDSLSEFTTADVIKMQDANKLGDNGANMLYMQQNRQKNRLLMEVPELAGSSYNYMLFTAHMGDKFSMNPMAPPKKDMQFMNQDIKFKGVPEKFRFLMNNCWWAFKSSLLIHRDTKAPMFPSDKNENERAGSTDLNVVTIRQIRGKSGPSGINIMLVISQATGLDPTMTEFYNLLENGKFGFGGNNINYFMELYPECKLSRTTIRGKVETDYKLRRAINITSELDQMRYFWNGYFDLIPSMQELYEGLKALGYDWNMLLETRGFYLLGDADTTHPRRYLHSWDFVRMLKKEYVPYWMTDDQIPAACKDIPREKRW